MPKLDLSLSARLPGSVHAIEHEGAKLIVVRSEDDRVFAFHDKCPHAFWPLSEGTLRRTVLECPGHGWEFDLETGRCLTAPVYCLTPVEVRVDGDCIRLQWRDDFSAAHGGPSVCPNDFPATVFQAPAASANKPIRVGRAASHATASD